MRKKQDQDEGVAQYPARMKLLLLYMVKKREGCGLEHFKRLWMYWFDYQLILSTCKGRGSILSDSCDQWFVLAVWQWNPGLG